MSIWLWIIIGLVVVIGLYLLFRPKKEFSEPTPPTTPPTTPPSTPETPQTPESPTSGSDEEKPMV